MEGKNACWVPGTDHASIATEAKVVAKLKEEGIEKLDLSRDEFLEKAWEDGDESSFCSELLEEAVNMFIDVKKVLMFNADEQSPVLMTVMKEAASFIENVINR